MGLPTIAEDNDLMGWVHEPLFQTGCLFFPAGEERVSCTRLTFKRTFFRLEDMVAFVFEKGGNSGKGRCTKGIKKAKGVLRCSHVLSAGIHLHHERAQIYAQCMQPAQTTHQHPIHSHSHSHTPHYLIVSCFLM